MGFHVHLIALSWEKDKFVICKCLIILILTDHFSSFDLCVSDVVVGVVERVHLRLLGGGSRDDVRQPGEVFGFAVSRPLIGLLSPFSLSHRLKQQIRTLLPGHGKLHCDGVKGTVRNCSNITRKSEIFIFI